MNDQRQIGRFNLVTELIKTSENLEISNRTKLGLSNSIAI